MSQMVIWTPRGDVSVIIANVNNLTATADPGASNDITQSYGIGSIWYNTTALRWWECQSAAAGAAVWVFSGAAYNNGGTNPPSETTQFGAGTALMGAEGNLTGGRIVSSAGVSPAGTGGDYVIAVYSMPANSFDVALRGVNIIAQGSVAANGNTKRIKLYWGCTTAVVGSLVTGGTVVCDTGAVTTNGAGWSVESNVFKYGAAGSNTQIALHVSAQVGNTVGPLLSPSLVAASESGAILIAVTGNATTTATDILFNFLEMNGMN